jgi:hypothetical protein
MNACLSLLLQASPLPDSAASPVSLQTAILVLLVAGVLFCLKALSDLRARIAALEGQASAPSPRAAAAAPAALPSPAAASGELSPEIVAVIAAAVHVTLGSGHRIVGITPSGRDDLVWSLEGRRQIFHSHKVR